MRKDEQVEWTNHSTPPYSTIIYSIYYIVYTTIYILLCRFGRDFFNGLISTYYSIFSSRSYVFMRVSPMPLDSLRSRLGLGVLLFSENIFGDILSICYISTPIMPYGLVRG